ncbi:MAG: hypothetical protein V1649_02660 [Patescibacteria group bacterium]
MDAKEKKEVLLTPKRLIGFRDKDLYFPCEAEEEDKKKKDKGGEGWHESNYDPDMCGFGGGPM